ncbi:MAG: hypothetical protein GX382_14440, partial [Syntrophomonadaceae bacterium]|nr:hypothetical protein [Syntrophomonadaceae bacterium]
MVIERANQVEKKFDETLLQDKTDAINRAIAMGIDGSKIAEMKSDLLSTQARALQVIFFGIQQEIAEISKSAEFKKQSPEKQKQIMRKLNMQAATFYTRMNASMEAAAQASVKVLQGFFESLDRDVEKAMGGDLFIPSDEMLPSMHRKKVMALQGSSEKLEKKHKELIDKLDALTNTTVNEYMNQKRAALEEEMSVLQKAYSDPDATEQEKGIIKMKMRGVSASMAGLNEEDARKGMMLDKNRISEDIDSVYKQWLQSLEAVNSAQRDAALSGLGRLKDLAEQLGHRKDLGIISQDDYTKAITKNYEAQIAQLNRMLPLMVKGSDAYRNTILEMYELKKAIKDQKEAYNENRRALREGAFSTISGMTQGNNRNALYHAVNILGMMSGPSNLARLTAPTMSMQDPFTLGKAQKAQQSLAATMDSYLMSQKYEQANVGKTVTKIYDFISKNNAIVLR